MFSMFRIAMLATVLLALNPEGGTLTTKKRIILRPITLPATTSVKKMDYFVDNDAIDIIPLIQKRINTEDIKKSLNEFSMVRKKTHVPIPHESILPENIKINVQEKTITILANLMDNEKEKPMTVFEKLDKQGANPYRRKEPANGEIKRRIRVKQLDKADLNMYKDLLKHAHNQDVIYRDLFDSDFRKTNDPMEQPQEFLQKIDRSPDAMGILKRQSELIEKLITALDDGELSPLRQKNIFGDFENLVQDMEEKNAHEKGQDPNLNKRFTAKTTSSTTKKLPSVKTVIDEVEIKKALKASPYVQRILALAARKRDEYYKNAGNKM